MHLRLHVSLQTVLCAQSGEKRRTVKLERLVRIHGSFQLGETGAVSELDGVFRFAKSHSQKPRSRQYQANLSVNSDVPQVQTLATLLAALNIGHKRGKGCKTGAGRV